MGSRCRDSKCGLFCCSEFHCSKFCFCYETSTAFAYSPWLPYTWKFQWIFLLYRWIIAAYFFGWLMYSAVVFSSPTYFIYLTNWSYIIWNAYLIMAALSVTIYCIDRTRSDTDDEPVQVGCCGVSTDESTWYQKIQWFLFLISTEAAVAVTFLYWVFLFKIFGADKVSVNIHLVNGIIALVDLWFSGTPVRLFHVVYTMSFSAVYVIFSGIYYAASAEAIYPVLDYGDKPVNGSVLAVLTVLIGVPALHCVMYAQYAVRFWVTYYLRKKCGLELAQGRAYRLIV